MIYLTLSIDGITYIVMDDSEISILDSIRF